ncbi:MAG: D-alanyl-D-alanine carboxypeptidase [Treponemataceae bacterium]|nr:D-alanyl-D-alanine carboxypeptidase [Treponemataceae bacterium]
MKQEKEKAKRVSKTLKKTIIITLSSLLLTAAAVTAALLIYGKKLRNPESVLLTADEKLILEERTAALYPASILNPLPYDTVPAELSINAESAILIDTSNGCILYEKNADEQIPPASMTKLAVMFVVEQEINTGRIAYDDIVPLPPESWAVNQPPDSSLMFLAEGQKVTLHELLEGLSVCSGNDAAYAVASYVSGSVEAFVERMNEEMEKLGLSSTHFVEPSGYSEENLTTARDFAAFARIYIQKYPESLKKYHSLESFSYPQPWNLPEGFSSFSVPAAVRHFYPDKPIKHNNTNKTLGLIPGADGLKTGYIDESGYNLAYTVMRGDTRFLSITLKGPGTGTWEGNKYRVEDAETFTDFGYRTFTTVRPTAVEDIPIIVAGGKRKSISLRQVSAEAISVPHIDAEISADGESSSIYLSTEVSVPDYIEAPIKAGDEYGSVTYSLGQTVLARVPLVADRDVEESWGLKSFIDHLFLD